MSRKKYNLKYKRQRCILSDVLPYEIPVTFSNRHFYDFLDSARLNFLNGNYSWLKDDDALDAIIRIITGAGPNPEIQTTTEKRYDNIVSISSFKKAGKKNPEKRLTFASIPFAYKIRHKENAFRELAICHPRNQLQIIDLYHKHKELILYYCNLSPFSIRRPTSVTKQLYFKDRTHYEKLSKDNTGVETYDKEYENLRSFFVYKEYSNIYKFYESYKYHRCEKKYNRLLKLDISKCFDSIYTHSLSWALINKESVKENINSSNRTFAGRFAQLMQAANYRETNGILIGPEFSRIFAELILQAIDRQVAHLLDSKNGHTHKVDYEIFRYVDDYFIFYNEETVKDDVLDILQVSLKQYKLYLNENKAITYDKPIITEITRAKQRVGILFDEKLKYALEDVEDAPTTDPDSPKPKKGSIYINSKSLITQFKTIIKECDVNYKDILNYSLTIVEGKCEKILKNYYQASTTHRSEKKLIDAMTGVLDFVFFIYSVSPRVNTTIKLCRILKVFITFLTRKDTNKDFRHLLFKFIFDNVTFILKKNKTKEYTQVETLYLLTILSELGKDYWLEVKLLSSYFGISKNDAGKYINNYELNYFSITVLLFYMREKYRYDELRGFVESLILSKYTSATSGIWKDAELNMLVLDTLVCPYISSRTKSTLLDLYGFSDHALQTSIINKRKYWFTKWDDFDFGKELDAKQSQEVY